MNTEHSGVGLNFEFHVDVVYNFTTQKVSKFFKYIKKFEFYSLVVKQKEPNGSGTH